MTGFPVEGIVHVFLSSSWHALLVDISREGAEMTGMTGMTGEDAVDANGGEKMLVE